MARADDGDQLLAAALAAKALALAQQALAAAQAAGERALPVPLDVQALLGSIADAMSRLQLPAPSVNVEAGAAPQISIAAPDVSVHVAAPPAPDVQVHPSFEVVLPEQPAPTVNVAAPVVSVEAPVVNVAAPSVRVEVPEQPPRMPWRMDVYRDPRTQLITHAEIVPVEEPA